MSNINKSYLKYTPEILSALAVKSRSISDMLRHLGLNPCGACHAHFSRKLRKYGIDTSHFNGQAWSKGKRRREFEKKPSEILAVNTVPCARLLRRALIDSGRAYCCERCGNKGEWNGEPLVLEIHHVDGDRTNNRKNNLKFLCPNCHSQTPNFGYKHKGYVPVGGL